MNRNDVMYPLIKKKRIYLLNFDINNKRLFLNYLIDFKIILLYQRYKTMDDTDQIKM